MSLSALSVPAPSGSPHGLLVILHGWGANAQDVAALATLLQLPHYQMLFPNAPFTYPYAPAGRMWYDLPADYSFFSQPEFRQQPQLQTSRTELTNWLSSLEGETGVPLSRTVLAGFSQGGAMTLDVGLDLPLAALMVLSGYLHAPIQAPPAAIPPILVVHGRQDLVVPLKSAHHTRDRLTALGATVDYHELDMGHEIQPGVLRLMQSFMERWLPITDEMGKQQ